MYEYDETLSFFGKKIMNIDEDIFRERQKEFY